MSKNSNKFVCTNCGYHSAKWMGQCPSCSEWNTLIEDESIIETKKGVKAKPLSVQTYSEVSNTNFERISTGFSEFDRVLGHDLGKESKAGFVKGSAVLISGDPGIGKSTLLLEICGNITNNVDQVIYVSAEESVHQVAMRAGRIIKNESVRSKIKFLHASDVDSIIETLDKEKAKFVVIDSIQTVESSEVSGFAGGISQVRNSSNKLVSFAKKNSVTMFIIGHINKDGNVAGPKLLEHIVDTVIQIEGDKQSDLRVIRGLKNRFGATNEVGIMHMDPDGLKDVHNPAQYLLSVENAPGLCKSAIMEGRRVLVVEVQSLISPTIFSLPKRVSEGISISRLQMVCAILQRYLKIQLSDKDVYVNIAGGIKVADRSLDLAIAMSLISSYKNKKLPEKLVAMGELALTGSVLEVAGEAQRTKELKRLGYNKIAGKSSISRIDQVFSLFS